MNRIQLVLEFSKNVIIKNMEEDEQQESKKTEYVNKLDQEESKLEEKAEEIAQEMQVNLPGEGLLMPLRVIALFTLIGGFSIIGSMFTDIISPEKTNVFAYLGRLFVGLVMVVVSYGILHLRRWSIWLYGFIAFVGLAINPAVAILPVIVVIYLYRERKQFSPSIIGFIVKNIYISLRNNFFSNLNRKKSPQNI